MLLVLKYQIIIIYLDLLNNMNNKKFVKHVLVQNVLINTAVKCVAIHQGAGR
jgi:hypothetical protein